MEPNRPSTSGGRYAPGDFRYNGRAAVALVPCLLLLAGTSSLVGPILLVGLMVTHLLDTLHLKEPALLSAWLALAATNLAVLFRQVLLCGSAFPAGRPLLLSILLLLLSGQVLFLSGAWVTLQFKWVQVQYPQTALTFERLIFAASPYTAAALQTYALAAATGISVAPFYYLAVFTVLYWLFALPAHSSFKTHAPGSLTLGGHVDQDAMICTGVDNALHAAAMLVLPPTLHIAIHWPTMLNSWADSSSLLILLSAPPLILMIASARDALWWLAKDDIIAALRGPATLIALAVLVAGVEARVVLYSLSQYVSLPYPWNVVFVSCALYGTAAAVAAHFLDLIRQYVNSAAATVLALIVGLAAAVAVGMPPPMLPAPALSAVYLVQYYYGHSVRDYAVFAIGALVCAAWFVAHNFWFLDITFGEVRLTTVCQLLIGAVALALVVPGLVAMRKASLMTPFLVLQAVIICVIEDRLHAQAEGEEGLYPTWAVVFTSVLGLFLTHALHVSGRISRVAHWLVQCIYGSKLALALLPSDSALRSAIALSVAFTPPLLLPEGPQRAKILPGRGVLQAVAVVVAVLFSRNTVFELLAWWTGGRPSEGTLAGTLLLLTAAGLFPLVTVHYPQQQGFRRAVVLLGAAGVMFILLKPPLPDLLGLVWDREHTPEHDVDDITIYGTTGHSSTWPSWLLVACVLLSGAAFSGAIPIHESSAARLAYAIAAGLGGGVYLSLQYFIVEPVLHVLIVLACTLTSIIMVFTHLPSTSSPKHLPWVFALLVALFPVSWLTHELFRAKTHVPAGIRLALRMGGRAGLEALWATLLMAIALQLKLKVASLLRATAVKHTRPSHAFAPAHRALHLQSTLAAQRLREEGDWMPSVGNAATIVSFILSLALLLQHAAGSDLAILALAPVLLLLQQDAFLFKNLTDQRRYFPVALGVTCYLTIASAHRLMLNILQEASVAAYVAETGVPNYLLYALKNIIMLLLPLPVHSVALKYLWDLARVPDLWLLLLTPICVPPVIMADLSSIRSLAIIGIVAAGAQYFVSQRIRSAGMKYI
eukprot:jgi/Chlat1/1474/Chrsp12S02013